MTPLPPDIAELAARAARILKEEGATEVYLFGSAAEGRARPDSDLDLAVRGLPAQRYFRALARAASAVKRDIDLIDLDHETPFTRYLNTSQELRLVG